MRVFDAAPSRAVLTPVDPRSRIAAGFAFAALVCFCRKPSVLLLALGLAAALAFFSRPQSGGLTRRLLALNVFMLFLAAFLPLGVSGRAFIEIGPLRWSLDGLERVAIIALRANAITIAMSALLATIPPATLAASLRRLGCPEKLAQILIFMIRYIELFHREYHRLRNAMRLRGFQPRLDRHTLRTFGNLIGLMLLRAVERSERILEAMKCRGFQGRFYAPTPMRLGPADALFGLIAVGQIALLGWMEWKI